jgi:DNA-binding NarL/FixJ family response regulator
MPATSRRQKWLKAFAAAHRLTERESTVVFLYTHGLVNDEIAQALGVTPSSVGKYWQRVYAKTGVRCRNTFLAALLLAAEKRA